MRIREQDIEALGADSHRAARTEAHAMFAALTREHTASFASDHDRDSETLSAQFQRIAKALAAGEDIVGGWYLTGQRFLSVCLIACSPHRLRPEIPCPQA